MTTNSLALSPISQTEWTSTNLRAMELRTRPARTAGRQSSDRVPRHDSERVSTASVRSAWPVMSMDELAESIEDLRPRMMNVARRFFTSESDCEDAIQDAVVSALQNIRHFRGECTLSTWLHRIVVNVCLMKLRSPRSRRTESLSESYDAVAVSESPDNMVTDETRQAVRAALTALPETHRTVISLRYFEGFTTAQTAALLGIRREAVKTRLHRGCAALRNVLASAEVEFV